MNAPAIFISGATSGIGRATALLLASRGYRILAHGRDPVKLDALAQALNRQRQDPGHQIYRADLTSFRAIHEMIEHIYRENRELYGIISNAGLYSREKVLVTEKQIEQTFMVNQLAGFILVNGLLGLLRKQSGEKHILQVSSMVHATSIDLEQVQNPEPYDGFRAYSESKLCNILMVNYLSARIKEDNILVNSLHPGVIDTNLLRAGWGAMGDPVESAAWRMQRCLNNQKPENNGSYFVDAQPALPAAIAEDPDMQEACWNLCAGLS